MTEPMGDGYDEMGREELLYRCRDWRKVANDCTVRIGELAAENAQLRADLEIARTERDIEAREAELWRERYEENITLSTVVTLRSQEDR